MNKYLSLIFLITAILLGCDKSTKEPSNAKRLTVINQCEPVKNQCEIKGEGLTLKIQFLAAPSYQRLLPIVLESEIVGAEESSLEEVSMALVIGNEEMPAEKMKRGTDNKHWEAQLLPFATVSKTNLKIKLTLQYKGDLYFAEIPVVY